MNEEYKSVQIRIIGDNNTQLFVETVNKFISDIDLIKGSIHIDAKSYLGVFSMDNHGDLIAKINSDDEDEVEIFRNKMEQFEVK